MGILGLLFLGAAAVCLAVVLFKTRTLTALARTETSTVRQLEELRDTTAQRVGPGRLRMMCEVEGTLQAGPGGLLRSPIGGVECVWYCDLTVQTSRYREKYRGVWKETVGTEIGSTAISQEPFRLDDGTGQILIAPLPETGWVTELKPGPIGMPDAVERVVEREESGEAADGGLGLIKVRSYEWVLQPGQQVFVHGWVNDLTGELMIGGIGNGRYLMSRHSQDVLVAKKQRSRLWYVVGAVNSGVVGILLIFLGWTT
jgi:hypothetical protein